MARKKFSELNLTSAFLFGAAMSDPEILRLTLEVLLGEQINSVTVSAEHTLLFNSENRNIRLDIFADSETHSYNVEMQEEDEKNLPKRSRYHQAEMDVLSLEPGQDFNELKPNIIIFICDFDPFGEGLYQYTFENRCNENDMPLDDGTKKIFFNINGKNTDDTRTELINLLKYMRETTDECERLLKDTRVSRLHEHITRLKKDREWERCYMRVEDLIKSAERKAHEYGLERGLKQGLKQGLEQGLEQGRKQGNRDMLELVTKMIEAGETESVKRLSEDEEFLAEMRRKYLGTDN